jgi:Fe(3+) dicitrate transport protein
VGLNVTLDPRWTLFAGVHRGFAPPRPEDVIANGDGKVVELAPELSWNSELGLRARPHPAVRGELTAFWLEFENQIVPASVAGGQGAAQTNGGRTRNAGVEAAWHLDSAQWHSGSHRFYSDLAYTWLPVAEYIGARQSAFDSTVSVTGNRLPYAARHLATLSAGWSHQSGVGARAELVHVAQMFSDDANTAAFDGSLNGQRGLLPAYDVVNVAADWAVPVWHATLFATVKNLLDTTYVVDRTRGMLPGSPRLVQGGAKFSF